RGEIAAPPQVRPDVPRPLDAICRKAMALRAQDRYPTAQALAQDIEHWLADEPVSACRDPLSVRLGRWTRRHRTLVTGGGGAGLVTLVALAVVLTMQTRSNQQLRAANDRERERFDLAQKAIRTFHTGVSEDVLLKQPQFKDLRDKLLKEAVEFYGQLEELLLG